jgi:hypothetical protein
MKAPPPVVKKTVVQHLREEYLLSEDQAAALVKTAAQSLRKFFSDLEALETSSQQLSPVEKKGSQFDLFHNLKGIFLHLGERRWADWVLSVQKEVECSGPLGLSKVTADLVEGVADLV